MRARFILGLVLVVFAAASATPAFANPQQAGVQVALRALGVYTGPIDGNVGPQTVKAIRTAQLQLHLPVTGIVDVKTRIALGPLGHPLFGARALGKGDFGLDVSVLQFLLAKRGIFHGALDGYLGPATAAALRVYQRQVGIAPSGVAGTKTQALLAKQDGIPVAPRPVAHPVVQVTQKVEHDASKYTGRYVVQPGDTLSGIAARFKLSVGVLARANKLKAGKLLLIGTRLAVPAAAVKKPAPVHINAPVAVAVAAPASTADVVEPAAVRKSLDAWSAKEGVPPSLVRALAWVESSDQGTTGGSGPQGVMQTMPATRSFVEDVLVGHKLPQTTDGDIEVGVLYLHHLLSEFKGNQRLALAAWNEGDTAVREQGVLAPTKAFVDSVLALAKQK
ncbi:MAG TPA: peptidoglycan-binding protein [Gaiellaceae bacterium]|nr:peptidoglycan-binding protein [Gaiellaceae bacterium]